MQERIQGKNRISIKQEICTKQHNEETKLLSDSDSIKRRYLQTGIEMCKAGLISQTLEHHAQVNLAILVEMPVILCLRSGCSRMFTSEGP